VIGDRPGARARALRLVDRAYDGPDYPGLCNTGRVGTETHGKDVVHQAVSAKPTIPPGRIILTGPAVSANYPDPSNSS